MSNEHLGRRALTTLLALNGTMFVVELVSGWRAESMGLIADGLDMGADAAVYLLALLAIGAAESRKLRAARFAGRVQLALAVLAMLDLARRAVMGSTPEPPTMVVVSLAALAVNVWCLVLLRRHRHGEVHLEAAWIFSATDVQANLGVLLAGALVAAFDSAIPDLVVGLIVCGLVLRGAIRIGRRVRAAELAAGAATYVRPG
ncbi:MAG: cation transporter [Gemmatimonadaceae bacterium]|nr:cation transporter [Gemmatimonadaceae bacterium]